VRGLDRQKCTAIAHKLSTAGCYSLGTRTDTEQTTK